MATMKKRLSKPTKGQTKTKANSLDAIIKSELAKAVIPGEIQPASGDIEAFNGRQTVDLTVSNTGDRPIQVGSHCHFFEVNRALKFDRAQAFGFKLCIPAGTAARFEPGEEKRVTLVAIAGNRVIYGINNLTDGPIDDSQVKSKALTRAAERRFLEKAKGKA